MAHIFLIGPGGVGKTTVGSHLAKLLGRNFVDLDGQFCERVGAIRAFLDLYGYAEYLRRNAELFGVLVQEVSDDSVFALSSGFLVTDAEPEIQMLNCAAVKRHGIAVALMPSSNFEESLQIVMARQLSRGLSLQREQQEKSFRMRAGRYMELGDLRVVHAGKPEVVADQIAMQLQSHYAAPTIKGHRLELP